MDPEIIEDLFEGSFQTSLEEAARLMVLPADEEAPYENKYKAREIYKQILDHDIIKTMGACNEVISMKIVLYNLMALNGFETEENGMARENFAKAIEEFTK